MNEIPVEVFDYYGVQLPTLEDGDVALEAVVLMKMMTKDGHHIYREFKSPTLHPMEALGMATSFTDTMRDKLMSKVRRVDPNS